MTSRTIEHARRIWDYLASFTHPVESDAVVVCCSYDLRVCDYACELLRAGLTSKIVLSGNTGNWTRHLWDRPESHVFRQCAEANGVARSQLRIEDRGTNIGENIAFARNVIPEAQTVTFVTKPNTILRVKLTVPLHWPAIAAHVACPAFRFPEDVSNVIGVFGVIHEMVGDIQRIREYPKLGYQVEHTIPDDVIESWAYLVKEGFTQHMMNNR